MKNYLYLSMAALICLCSCSPNKPCQKIAQDVEVYYGEDSDDQDDGDTVWIGPGWYYGVWFNSREDYDGWRRNNPRDQRGDFDRQRGMAPRDGDRGGGRGGRR